MSKDIKPVFFWSLALAALRLMLKHGNSLNSLQICGKEVGKRLADVFFSKYCIFDKLDERRTEDLIKPFIETFIDNIKVKDEIISFTNRYSEYQGTEGKELISIILNEVFHFINPTIHFLVNEKGIKYEFKKN